MSTGMWVLVLLGIWLAFGVVIWAIFSMSHREDHGARKQERDHYHTDVTVTRTGSDLDRHSSDER
ncbi:MAG TPA: hypothetical protein VF077_10345 [Nitrospiraceae bacterium]